LFMTATGTLRLKLNESAESQLAKSLRVSDATIGRVGPRMLAGLIASHTVNALVDGGLLDAGSAPELLREYGSQFGPDQAVQDCILRFSMREDEKVVTAVNWLNSHAHLHRWEIAHRIAPPKSFYKAHPEILEACKLCGAVVLDIGTPSTVTTGSINPLAGDFLANWIQSALDVDPTERRPRFFFHVVIPPRHWEAIARAHFRADHGI
jgi:hypothetical protein